MKACLARWAWLLVIAVPVALAIAVRLDAGSAPAGAQQGNVIATDADANDPDVDASTTRLVGDQFDTSTDITAVGTPYTGYRISIEFDDSILSFVPVGPLDIVYTGLGSMVLDAQALVRDCDSDTNPEVFGGSYRAAGTTTATGKADFIRFQCIGQGATGLHFATMTECPDYGSTTMALFAEALPTSLVDATVVCDDAAPTPTPLPPVGGIAEVPSIGGTSDEEVGAFNGGSGWSASGYAALACAVAVAVGVIVASSFYARRRWLP
jgi:hypothetical protein